MTNQEVLVPGVKHTSISNQHNLHTVNYHLPSGYYVQGSMGATWKPLIWNSLTLESIMVEIDTIKINNFVMY